MTDRAGDSSNGSRAIVQWGGPPPSPAPRRKIVRLSQRIRRKRQLLGVLRQQLACPGDIGHNWDALLDALRDLSWLEAAFDEVILYHESWPFPAPSAARATYRELLEALAEDPPPTPRVTLILPDRER